MPPSRPAPQPAAASSHDDAFDLLRGIAELTDRPLVGQVARTLAAHPGAPLGNAFNANQIQCKRWLVTELAARVPGPFAHVLVVGGWVGVLPALMLEHEPVLARRITTLDIDPACAPVASTLNQEARQSGRFRAVTADMTTATLKDLAGDWPPIDLVVNTSMEHIKDGAHWISSLPRGLVVVLQCSNDRRPPDHVSPCPDLATFLARVRLSERWFAGRLSLRSYTRFMQIGRV